jgi:hypothetical protein
MHRPVGTLVSTGLVLGLLAANASGAEPAPPPASCRAGYVLPVAGWARPSETPSYVGYYVGGGCPCLGRPPLPTEGVWGWDYAGCVFCRRVWLNWCPRRYQGGTGSYRTDGPCGNMLAH